MEGDSGIRVVEGLRVVECWERMTRTLMWQHFPSTWDSMATIMFAGMGTAMLRCGDSGPSAASKARQRLQFQRDFKRLMHTHSVRKDRRRLSASQVIIQHLSPDRQSGFESSPPAITQRAAAKETVGGSTQTAAAEAARDDDPRLRTETAMIGADIVSDGSWTDVGQIVADIHDEVAAMTSGMAVQGGEAAVGQVARAADVPRMDVARVGPNDDEGDGAGPMEAAAPSAKARGTRSSIEAVEVDRLLTFISPGDILDDPEDEEALKNFEKTKEKLRAAIDLGTATPFYESDDNESEEELDSDDEEDGVRRGVASVIYRTPLGIAQELWKRLRLMTLTIQEMYHTEVQYTEKLRLLHEYFQALEYEPSVPCIQFTHNQAVASMAQSARSLHLPSRVLVLALDHLSSISKQISESTTELPAPGSRASQRLQHREKAAVLYREQNAKLMDVYQTLPMIVQEVAKAFHQISPMLRLYGPYMALHRTVTHLVESADEDLASRLERIERRACRGHLLPSLLISPIQRVPRYVILLKALRKEARKAKETIDHWLAADADKNRNGRSSLIIARQNRRREWMSVRDSLDGAVYQLEKAMKNVESSARAANEEVRNRHSRLTLLKLYRQLKEGESGRQPLPDDLVRPGRHMIISGTLRKIHRRGGVAIYFYHLLSDLFLYSEPGRGGLRLHSIVQIAYPGCSVHRVPPTERFANALILVGSRQTLVFTSKNNRECETWYDHISMAIRSAQRRVRDAQKEKERQRKAGSGYGATGALPRGSHGGEGSSPRFDAAAALSRALNASMSLEGHAPAASPRDVGAEAGAAQPGTGLPTPKGTVPALSQIILEDIESVIPLPDDEQKLIMDAIDRGEDSLDDSDSSDEDEPAKAGGLVRRALGRKGSVWGAIGSQFQVRTKSSDREDNMTARMSASRAKVWEALQRVETHTAAAVVSENLRCLQRVQEMFMDDEHAIPTELISLTTPSSRSSVGRGRAAMSDMGRWFIRDDFFFDLSSSRPRILQVFLFSHALLIGEVLAANKLTFYGFAELAHLSSSDVENQSDSRHCITLACATKAAGRGQVPCTKFKITLAASDHNTKYAWLDLIATVKRGYLTKGIAGIFEDASSEWSVPSFAVYRNGVDQCEAVGAAIFKKQLDPARYI